MPYCTEDEYERVLKWRAERAAELEAEANKRHASEQEFGRHAIRDCGVFACSVCRHGIKGRSW